MSLMRMAQDGPSPNHKSKRMAISLQNLLSYEREDNRFLSQIVTGDESFIHFYTPEMKSPSMERKRSSSPVHKIFKVVPSADKVLITVFWDIRGDFCYNFLKKEMSVRSSTVKL